MELVVPKSAIGKRLDVFLTENLSNTSRSLINKLIKDGQIKSINKIKASNILKGDEKFLVNIDKPTSKVLKAIPVELDILYSDEHIAVINKPQGMVVHPGAGVRGPTLCHGLLHHFPNMFIGNAERPGLVHRLDKDTAGLMVIAKSHEAQVFLSKAFKDRKVTKIYQALVWGEIKKPEFELITGHARHPHNRLRFFTNIPAPKTKANVNVRLAHTKFKVIKKNYGMTLLKATLHTGRTHQIRAHLADIGHPIVEDKLYGGKRDLSKDLPIDLKNNIEKLSGQALLAERLEFEHPISKEKLSFTAHHEIFEELINFFS